MPAYESNQVQYYHNLRFQFKKFIPYAQKETEQIKCILGFCLSCLLECLTLKQLWKNKIGYSTSRKFPEKVQTCKKKQSMFTQLTEIDMNFHNVYSRSY